MRLRRNNAAAAPQTETAAFKKWFGKSKVVDADGKPLVVYHGTPRGGFSVFKLVYDDRPGAVFFSNKRTVAGDYAGYEQKADLPGPVPKSPPVFKSVTDLRKFVKSPENDFEGWKMYLLESEQVIEEDDSPSYTGMGARIVPRYVLWWEKGDRLVDIAEGYQLDVLLFEANAAVKRRLDIAGIYAVYLRMLKPMVVNGKGAPWMSIPYEGGYWKTDQLADIARSKGYDGLILRNIYDNPIQQIELSDVYVAFDPTQIKSATANVGTFDRKDADIRKNPATIRLRGRGPSPAVERLLRDFTEASFPNPLGSAERNERVLKGIDALVRLEPDGRKVFVAEVRALRPRQGIGTRAMQFLTDLADKHGVQLALFPHPFGTAQMEVGALVNFYRRFGFQYADEDGEAGDEMVRFPRESNPRRRVRRNPHPQTETPEFERWFGNSKMIDAEGKPQRLYHITAAEFTEFKPGGHDPRLSGRVIYLTPYPHDIPAGHNVRGTVRGERYRPSTNVMPVYASIQRPLYIFDADDAKYAERFRLDSFAFPRTVSDKSLAALKAAGYDGIVYGGYRDAEGFDVYTGRNVEIIAFEPTQIKSAIGNRGTFDPTDPDIRHNPSITPATLPPNFTIRAAHGGLLRKSVRLSLRENGNEVGHMVVKQPRKEDDLWEVDAVKAPHGYGPFLYDLALESVRKEGGRGLYPDRTHVSPSARDVWERFYETRKDVTSHPLPPSVSDHDKYHYASGGPFDFLDRYYAKRRTPYLAALARKGQLEKVEFNPRRRVRRNPHPQTDTPAFKRWFGASKVVDAEGNPLVVYHGTQSSFEAFGIDLALFGGVGRKMSPTWFTENSEHAAYFARESGRGGSIMPVYLSIQRPLVVKNAPALGWRDEDKDKVLKKAKRGGYDGVIFPAMQDLNAGVGDTYVVFEPTQIKSAIGNRGTFEPEDPNIMHNPRRRKNPKPQYTLLGVDDEVQVCEDCGKSDLKCTVVLGVLDEDGNVESEVRFGRDCATKALRKPSTVKAAKMESLAREAEYKRVWDMRVGAGSRVKVEGGRFPTYYQTYPLADGRTLILQTSDPSFRPPAGSWSRIREGAWVGHPAKSNPKPAVRYDEDTGELLVASGSGVRLTKLGGMRSDAARVARLAELVPERATHAFALHPANWQRTYTSLTGKDLDKVTRYKPEPISLVPGTLVGEMKHANAYLWYGDDVDAIRYQQSVRRLEDADIATYRMPELLVPRTNPRRALRFVRPPRRVVRHNGLGMERSVTTSPAVAAFVKEWNARDMDMVFADMGVRVDVGLEGGDYIELELIEALRPGRGNGGRALRALLDLVDKHNLGVTLTAMPFHRYDAEGNPLPGLDDLVRIYQRFGFRLEEGQDEDEDEDPESYYMTRSPRR